jgi:hypothetical protein
MTETPPCRDTGQWLSSQKTASATRSKTSRLTQVEDGSRFAALEPVSQAVIARFGGIEADAARGTWGPNIEVRFTHARPERHKNINLSE